MILLNVALIKMNKRQCGITEWIGLDTVAKVTKCIQEAIIGYIC